MQPNPPGPGFPQYGQPPMAAGPIPAARPKPRANAPAAVIAGVLALLAATMLVWFALYNVFVATEANGGLSGITVQNMVSGALSAVVLVVAAGFTFARRIPGVWTLFGFCVFYVVAVFVGMPLVWGTPLSSQVKWLFSFDDSDSTAMALMIVFSVLAAVAAAIAGSLKSSGTKS
ncbi:Putative membrane protein [Amycolatopsis japonica]|uniref:Putative membrane protein n=2 Tax=Amycolatopsis japonica TaxID=208439 RepID=A0A075UQL3_9PSEU|nr:Putative membrane protein [Amycolatopsis japonica]